MYNTQNLLRVMTISRHTAVSKSWKKQNDLRHLVGLLSLLGSGVLASNNCVAG